MPEFIQPAFDFIEPLDLRRPKLPERVFTCTDAGVAAAEVVRRREGIKRDNAIVTKGILPGSTFPYVAWGIMFAFRAAFLSPPCARPDVSPCRRSRSCFTVP